jgi:hypothetical protein
MIPDEMHFVLDKNGRPWNERAWRQTLDDIAAEMGERRPKEQDQSGEVVKVVIGIDSEFLSQRPDVGTLFIRDLKNRG